MESEITAFIDGLIMHDYILFGSAFVLFILFIILGLVLRKKIGLAVFLIIIAFSTLILAPTLGYTKLHAYLFKNTTTITKQKKLEFTEAIVINGTLVNESKYDFKSCKITANVHQVSKNEIKNYLLKFKTINKMSIVEEDILKGETINFKMIVEPFTYKRDYSITIGADCK